MMVYAAYEGCISSREVPMASDMHVLFHALFLATKVSLRCVVLRVIPTYVVGN